MLVHPTCWESGKGSWCGTSTKEGGGHSGQQHGYGRLSDALEL